MKHQVVEKIEKNSNKSIYKIEKLLQEHDILRNDIL